MRSGGAAAAESGDDHTLDARGYTPKHSEMFASWRERNSAARRTWLTIRGGRGWREERCEGEHRCAFGAPPMKGAWAGYQDLRPAGTLTRCFCELSQHAGSKPQTRSYIGSISSCSGAIPLGVRTLLSNRWTGLFRLQDSNTPAPCRFHRQKIAAAQRPMWSGSMCSSRLGSA